MDKSQSGWQEKEREIHTKNIERNRAYQMNIINPSIEIIDAPSYETMLQKIERIGRVCYKSEDKITEGSAETFIRSIIVRGHESVIEHQSISVKVICDRGVTHEIVRHRLASYSQESTRYCNYTDGKFGGQLTFIDPCTGFGWDLETEKGENLWKYWCKAMDAAEWSYRQMLKHGATPQEARSVLPNSLKTEIVMTMDLREWRHFLRLRGGKAAHPQIRQIADMIRAAFVSNYPVFFEDLEVA
jgi:thymidylate synthase (FAD)